MVYDSDSFICLTFFAFLYVHEALSFPHYNHLIATGTKSYSKWQRINTLKSVEILYKNTFCLVRVRHHSNSYMTLT